VSGDRRRIWAQAVVERCKEGGAGSGRLWSRAAAMVRSWDESGGGGDAWRRREKIGNCFTAPPLSSLAGVVIASRRHD
jgi:hypothetical protein